MYVCILCVYIVLIIHVNMDNTARLAVLVLHCRQLLFDNDIPCSYAINTVHFFPHGGQRGNEKQLAVRLWSNNRRVHLLENVTVFCFYYSFKDENAALKALGIKVLTVLYIYTCAHTKLYVHSFVYVHTQECTYVHLCMYVRKNVHISICVCTHTFKNVHTFSCVYVHIQKVHMFVCTYVLMQNVHTHMHVR